MVGVSDQRRGLWRTRVPLGGLGGTRLFFFPEAFGCAVSMARPNRVGGGVAAALFTRLW